MLCHFYLNTKAEFLHSEAVEIETGRYQKIRLEEHTWEPCQSNEIDENHFICGCIFLNVKH